MEIFQFLKHLTLIGNFHYFFLTFPFSQLVWAWEILEIFIDNYNFVPKWIVGNYTFPYINEEGGWTYDLITTVRF